MRITVSIPAQTLELRDAGGRIMQRHAVSTARNGPGERSGSYCTPRGRHVIRAKIGAGETANTVFVRRRPTGEVWTPELAASFPGRDWILTRILWLSGRRPGFNRLGEVDTMRRYIYIHGSPDSAQMGEPGSIGCIRMHNPGIIELFDAVPPFTFVDIDDFRVDVSAWYACAPVAMPLREEVFVREQGVPPELERDEFDAVSRHAIARDASGRVIGTGRLLPDGHIGRMAVTSLLRGQGVGRALMDALITEAWQTGLPRLLLNAQVHALGFYRQFGFVETGAPYEEAGLPHQAMCRDLA